MGAELLRLKQKSTSTQRPFARPSLPQPSAPQSPITKLQRNLGNQAVQRLLRSGAVQFKLKIGRAGDKYEQEADQVAEEVLRSPGPVVTAMSNGSPNVQKKCAACASGQGLCPKCAEEEEGIQRKPLASALTPRMQRQLEEPEEEEEEKVFLQTKEVAGHTPELSPGLAARISTIQGGGQPLPESARAFFEPRFGHDFSQVRVHTSAQAAESARAVNARAFTLGRDVVFGPGQYAPETDEGKKLLAHELTHFIQQRDSLSRARTGRVGLGEAASQYEPGVETRTRPLPTEKPIITCYPALEGILRQEEAPIEGRREEEARLNLDPRLIELTLSVLRGEHRVTGEVGLSEPLNLAGLRLPGIPPSQLNLGIQYNNDCNRAFQEAVLELQQDQEAGGPVVSFEENPWRARLSVAYRSGTVRFNPDLTVSFDGTAFDSALFTLSVATGVSAEVPEACRSQPSPGKYPPCEVLRRRDGSYPNWLEYMLVVDLPGHPLGSYRRFRNAEELQAYIAGCEATPVIVIPTPTPEPQPLDYTLYFFYDSTAIRPESNEGFRHLVSLLQKVPALHLQLTGHASLEGTEEYNLDLSERRAEAVREDLVREGIEASRILTFWHGESAPAVPEPPVERRFLVLPSVERARNLNRRVEVVVFDPTGRLLPKWPPLRLRTHGLRLPGFGVKERPSLGVPRLRLRL